MRLGDKRVRLCSVERVRKGYGEKKHEYLGEFLDVRYVKWEKQRISHDAVCGNVCNPNVVDYIIQN